MSPVYKRPRSPEARFHFTVLTPTYNRAHTLARVYESLLEQSYQSFEWVVVDDGSTDHTAQLVAQWQREASFPITYHWQANQHKKSAFNLGVRVAQGELIVVLDSDDTLLPDSLYEMVSVWWSLPDDKRSKYVGVTGLCQQPGGAIVGDLFPYDNLDATALDLYFKYRVRGEKFGCLARDVLLEFPFPQYPGFVPESLVWRAIARAGYKHRFVNKVFRVYYPEPDSLSAQGKESTQHALGLWLLAQDTLALCMPWFRYDPRSFLMFAVRYVRFRLHMMRQGHKPPARLSPLGWGARLQVALMAPVGGLLFLRDLWREHSAARAHAHPPRDHCK